MKHSKAQGLSLNTIIIAILVLLVLVILVMIFTGYTGKWGKDFKAAGSTCFGSGGKVISIDEIIPKCQSGHVNSDYENDPDRFKDVEEGQVCCTPLSSA